MISGRGPPGATVIVRIDGREAAQGKTADGRYAISLPSPLTPGGHRLEVFGEGFTQAVMLQISAAQPLVAGPVRTENLAAGLRADWMTPGGGVQSTILVR